jgi:hypothetical protein
MIALAGAAAQNVDLETHSWQILLCHGMTLLAICDNRNLPRLRECSSVQ